MYLVSLQIFVYASTLIMYLYIFIYKHLIYLSMISIHIPISRLQPVFTTLAKPDVTKRTCLRTSLNGMASFCFFRNCQVTAAGLRITHSPSNSIGCICFWKRNILLQTLNLKLLNPVVHSFSLVHKVKTTWFWTFETSTHLVFMNLIVWNVPSLHVT